MTLFVINYAGTVAAITYTSDKCDSGTDGTDCASWDQCVKDPEATDTYICLYGSDKSAGTLVEKEKFNPNISSSTIRSDSVRLIQYVLSFLAIIAIAMIIYGGLIWIMSSGSDDKVTKARKIIIAATIGLLIVSSAWIGISFIAKTAKDLV